MPGARSSLERLRALTLGQAALAGSILAIPIEAVTAGFRFGAGLQSTRDTAWIARFTFGLRIHHGYVGLLLLLLASIGTASRLRRNALLIVGIALLFSDLFHHFLVLWPITGSPQFDLFYAPLTP